jgi:hypothetical protein
MKRDFIASVRLHDCQLIILCLGCGDVTGTQSFMSREMAEQLYAGNTPAQIEARN